ncbi:bacterio-opsin activator domain-containing protein [Halobacterium rubrum]|uniref:bacterio-opsin activator domain-containing protein n=1 Tax=Halobacterium TaxID=2239 RepID=UPI001F464435|nr:MULTISPECIES: bacterio-opsin activator domain-containing protein [Halobacterium]MDH5019756.1 bacterio-opsin activator domain-containing protein [Halobacterium rubrum]
MTSTDTQTIGVLFAGEDPETGPTAGSLADDDRLEVTQVRDFVAARDRVDDPDIDCVVAVHVADGFDGVAFLEAVRQTHAELPVVLVPTAVDGEVARRAVEADATGLVPSFAADATETVVERLHSTVPTYAAEGDTRMPISDLTVEAERRLKEQALDEAPIGITISDAENPEEPVIYMNDSFEDITGYPAEEVVGANHRFLQGPGTDEEKVAAFGEAIGERRDAEVVLRNYRRDGSLFWNQVTISPIFDENGDVSHYVGFQMDVTERREAQQDLQAERESLDRLLDRVNGLVNDVTSALVRADNREEIEGSIAERVGTGSEYAGAWLGRYDATENTVEVREATGDCEGAGGTTLSLDGDSACVVALREVLEKREATTVDEAEALPGVRDGERCVLVPLTYRSTTYGVLAVATEERLLDDREQVLLRSLGRTVGASINDVLTRRTIATDTVLNIGVELSDDDIFLVDLAAAVDTTFEQEATIADSQEPGVLTLVSTPHDDAEAVVEAARAYDDVLDAEVIVSTDDESVVQFSLENSPLVDVLSEFGSRVRSMRADGSTLELEVRVGTEGAARRVLSALRETYEDVELVAYHEDDPEQTPHGFREELRSELTDRQLTALQKAYVSGYFEWPRRAEGKQLAESMDIVPSTYHQHLQAAKQKLVGAFFEE